MELKGRLELTWTGKEEVNNIEKRLLIEDYEKSFGDLTQSNMLIHGDNLYVLKALQNKYAGEVDFIYIDPPYNTGKIFDDYPDKLEHSIWLNIMYQRLQLLFSLMKDGAVICVQIDDSESHYLKVMLDEIFGRSNYLNTFYIQVRYPGKTLAEDSDYQKVIEQVLVYTTNRNKVSLNRPTVDYSIDKFKWKITELSEGNTIELGNKKVVIFKENEYKIEEIAPSLTGLKETWATGSLTRVKASAGEFFELYLADRKDIDGLGTMYKVYGIGEDGLGFRYITGPKKASANKGKFYSGIPLDRLEELKNGGSLKYLPVPNFYDFAGNFGNCRLEGGVGFKGGKKPEVLIKMLLDYYTKPGDLVLDSFLGSASTIAVAHKMNRRWIGIEFGEHIYSLDKPRMDLVISGNDKTGISKEVGWNGGGGYHFYELSEPLFVRHPIIGVYQFNKGFDIKMIRNAICNIEGYTYDEHGLIHGYSSEKHYIHITKDFVNGEYVNELIESLSDEESLSIYALKYQSDLRLPDNIEIIDIMKRVLPKCINSKDGE